MEQQQAAQLHSNFGIGIEREIYSQPYFSYHYGYRSLSQMPIRHQKSKLYEIENLIKDKFKNINLQILFLNISSRGTFVNFVVKDKQNFDKLGIIPIRETNSFTTLLNDIGGNDIPHREIFPRANLDDFDIDTDTARIVKKILSEFSPTFYCVGFDSKNKKLDYNDIHLELYPEKNVASMEEFINILKDYGVSTPQFEKYFLNFKKFSHVKFRIDGGEIKNIKYYRSINVNIPEFYYV